MDTSDRFTSRWLTVGGFVTIVFGFFGYLAGSPESVNLGLGVGSVVAALFAGAWWLWLHQESGRPAPAAEYLVAVWAVAYLVLVAISASQRRISLADSFFLLPPVSFVPLAARIAVGDDGDPSGRARSVAYRLHQLFGWALSALGVLFAISLFFIVLAPVPLIPGLMHLRAASLYRSAKRKGIGPSPV